jgi:hypothetical protein
MPDPLPKVAMPAEPATKNPLTLPHLSFWFKRRVLNEMREHERAIREHARDLKALQEQLARRTAALDRGLDALATAISEFANAK